MLINLGPWAPPVFMALKVVTVVAAFPSAPVTFLGGVLFGPVCGTLINVVAATTGASAEYGGQQAGRGYSGWSGVAGWRSRRELARLGVAAHRLVRPAVSDDDFKTRFWRAAMALYPAVRYRDSPWTPLRKPLSAARVALVTTCGVHLATDPPFDPALDRRGGDPSFREIPGDVRPEQLAIRHGHYDEASARQDLNCVFPLWRLQSLAAEGLIGSVAPRHYGLRGAINRTGPLIRRSAPELARRLASDAVDIVLLTPC